jgi:hypothetical protein
MIIHKDYKLRLIIDPEIEHTYLFSSDHCCYARNKALVKPVRPSDSMIEIDMGIARFAAPPNGSYLEPLNSYRASRKMQLIYDKQNIYNKPICHADDQALEFYPLSLKWREGLNRRPCLLLQCLNSVGGVLTLNITLVVKESAIM